LRFVQIADPDGVAVDDGADGVRTRRLRRLRRPALPSLRVRALIAGAGGNLDEALAAAEQAD
jgi:hypothetical protein